MAYQMKGSPAKRGAIEGVGPNASPMQLGWAARLLFKGGRKISKSVSDWWTKKIAEKSIVRPSAKTRAEDTATKL